MTAMTTVTTTVTTTATQTEVRCCESLVSGSAWAGLEDWMGWWGGGGRVVGCVEVIIPCVIASQPQNRHRPPSRSMTTQFRAMSPDQHAQVMAKT